jgi:uncharacterized protein
MIRCIFSTIITGIFLAGCMVTGEESVSIKLGYRVTPVPFNEVHVNDSFWLPRIETNRTVTIPASFQKCEEMGRLDNFLIAGGRMEGDVRGEMPFDDTDVYKIIEGASYSLTTIPDPALEAYIDSLIGIIAVGQEADGYLTTYKSIDTTRSPASWCPGGSRWQHLACSHELYNSGHLFEAAAAHFQATGKRNFLDIALKNADLLVSVFGPDKNNDIPGHQVVETGLIKLYAITGKDDYLNLARHFLDSRGDSTLREIRGSYSQDHMPVTQQAEAVGHAVRAVYMYSGMTDIAALQQDPDYRDAVRKIWENVVEKKIYITGGLGARHDGEAFGDNYELPALTAYNETCAAIANVYWNHRLFMLEGDAAYIDVLERSLYNGVISGVALDGKTFFYPNPLECNMEYRFNYGGTLSREPWFSCSCCPSSVCRFIPSVPGYIYAQEESTLYVNLFIQSETEVNLNGTLTHVEQQTDYPWKGEVKIKVSPDRKSTFTVKVRIPGWASDKPLPGGLYYYTAPAEQNAVLKVNGKEMEYSMEKGFAVIAREWEPEDEINLTLPMEVRKVKAITEVTDAFGKVSLERGPLVYCVEEMDNADVIKLTVPDGTAFSSEFHPQLLNGVEVVTATGAAAFKAIPYYAWNNRGANKMKVWLGEN